MSTFIWMTHLSSHHGFSFPWSLYFSDLSLYPPQLLAWSYTILFHHQKLRYLINLELHYYSSQPYQVRPPIHCFPLYFLPPSVHHSFASHPSLEPIYSIFNIIFPFRLYFIPTELSYPGSELSYLSSPSPPSPCSWDFHNLVVCHHSSWTSDEHLTLSITFITFP